MDFEASQEKWAGRYYVLLTKYHAFPIHVPETELLQAVVKEG
jgi:hypothetical protein